MSFEDEYAIFLEEQRRSASGVRLEQLHKDLTGEKKLLNMLWSVFRSFDGFKMEHEIVSLTGVRMYIDVFYEPLKLSFECEGFVAHAENITRDRFSFERMRVRTMVTYGYKYIPFSWDELDKKLEMCRRAVYEMLGQFSSVRNDKSDLTVNEREVLRYAVRLNRPFRMNDVKSWLQLGAVACRQVIKTLMGRKLIKPLGSSMMRNHQYILEDQAVDYIS